MEGTNATRAARSERRSRHRESLILGVPARFMRPRLVFLASVFVLLAFGSLMIFSASSITSLISDDMGNNPTYYVTRQLVFAAFGVVFAAILGRTDYHVLTTRVLTGIVAVTYVLLILVFLPIAGADAYGATRWIAMGPFSLQPSEFAKITVVLVGATLLSRYDEGASLREIVPLFVGAVLVPFVLVLLQPDKGTVMICGVTLVAMAYFAGVPAKWCVAVLAAAVAVMVALSFKDAYSRSRITTMLNPWEDEYGTGYQLIQGFYAFGSGGIFGVGIGMGRQKYSYLPMAYNDFILAVIGEECGLVGTVGVLVAFAVMLYAGFQIARFAPDLCGRLIACGSVSLLVIQMLLNVSGVIGNFPLSGKPIPFLSYGGSSIISSLMLVGLVYSVSRQSRLPLTEHDERRRDFAVSARPGSLAEGVVGDATPRSARASDPFAPEDGSVTSRQGRRAFTVLGGGRGAPRSDSPEGRRAERDFAERHAGARVTTDARGRKRIDLGPSASERLRTNRDRPEVRGVDRNGRTRRGDRRGR